jgi:hypothetical protein
MPNYCQYDMPNTCTHYFWDNVHTEGQITAITKNFVIPHPLDEENKVLIHTCIESPQADLHYSGTTKLVNGSAVVKVDTEACVHSPMDEGTFAKLTCNPRVFLQSADSFDRVRGTVRGGLLSIECENRSSTAEVHWLIVAERQDRSFKESKMAGAHGHLETQGIKAEWMLDESQRPSRRHDRKHRGGNTIKAREGNQPMQCQRSGS